MIRSELKAGAIVTIFTCAAAGFANGLALFYMVARHPMGAVMGRLGRAWIHYGPILAPTLGLLFGGCFAIPVGYAYTLRERVTLDALERAGLLQSAVSLAVSVCLVPLFLLHRHQPSGGLLVALFFAGVVGVLFFGGRLHARRAWLRRVRAGAVSDWYLTTIGAVNAQQVASLLPMSPLRSSPVAAALVQRVGRCGVGPYREGQHVVLRALVAG